MSLEIQINRRKFFLCCALTVHRGPRVYLDYRKINIMESLGNGGAGCAVTTRSRNRALLDVTEKSCTTLLKNKFRSNKYTFEILNIKLKNGSYLGIHEFHVIFFFSYLYCVCMVYIGRLENALPQCHDSLHQGKEATCWKPVKWLIRICMWHFHSFFYCTPHICKFLL